MKNLTKNQSSPLLGLVGRLALILVIPLLMYFWGTAIIYNLANFWNVFTPSRSDQLLLTSPALIPAPILSPLPTAVKDEKIDVSGKSQEGSQVTLYLNNRAVSSLRSGKGGEFTFTGVILLEGENTIHVKALNDQKTESPASEKLVVNFLKKPPFLEVTNLPEKTDLHQKQSSFVIKGMTSPQAKVTVGGSQAFVDSNGAFSFIYPLTDGENRIVIEAADEAGNKTTLEKVVNYFRE